jgi:hypothetical protein
MGLTTLPCKKKIVEKPPRNSVGFCGGGQGLSWAVKPRKEEENSTLFIFATLVSNDYCNQWKNLSYIISCR